MFRILVVEDDDALRNLLRTLLESQSYRVLEANLGRRAILDAQSARPDLVLADLGLEDMDGTEMVRAIRSSTSVPILVLTARATDEQKVLALDAGADDYVTKPFSTSELLARIRAALRRNSHNGIAPTILRFGSLSVDIGARRAVGPAGAVHLTPLEYRLLERLALNPGMIVTQRQLLHDVWGPNHSADSRGLRSYIKFLRQKLEPDPRCPRYILTEIGVGYRLCPD
jgi:two-component system KDP operon response regulator KdpE